MIKIKTVFVLGAGASDHCGYLLGQGLYHQIVKNLERPGSYNGKVTFKENFMEETPYIQFIRLGIQPNTIWEFRQALLYADRISIDKFLERRSDWIDLGKICIAQALIPFESNHNIRSINGNNWYQLLFNELDGGFDKFSENNFSVITFNYDRSFEHYLFNTIKHSYGIPNDNVVAKVVKSIPIVHVHGQLDMLDWQAEEGQSLSLRAYGGQLTEAGLKKASGGIKIIHEDIGTDPDFLKARALIADAERVFFLGFGYDLDNLERLGLANAQKAQFIGTGFGLSPSRRAKIGAYFQSFNERISIKADFDIVNLFRNTHI